VDYLSAPDPGSHIDPLARLVQWRSLFPGLVGPMLVVMPRVLGQDLPEVSFAVDKAGGRGTRVAAFLYIVPQKSSPWVSGQVP